MKGIELIEAERKRQIEIEGWTPKHDDEHRNGELARAAITYTRQAQIQVAGEIPRATPCESLWPWAPDWWKPSGDPIRNLVKAGALIAAEIDRLQRANGGRND